MISINDLILKINPLTFIFESKVKKLCKKKILPSLKHCYFFEKKILSLSMKFYLLDEIKVNISNRCLNFDILIQKVLLETLIEIF